MKYAHATTVTAQHPFGMSENLMCSGNCTICSLKGNCPACGNSTLFRGSKGYITCSWLKCPNPGAAHEAMVKQPSASSRVSPPKEKDRWMVVRKRDTDAPDVWIFDRYDEAAMHWDQVQANWTEVWFCRVAYGPNGAGMAGQRPTVPSPSRVSQEENPSCVKCGGPHPFDTSLPSPTWNAVIRAADLPDYLCLFCILKAFVKAQQGFTATLWGESFNGDRIEVIVDGAHSTDVERLSDENNELRISVRELSAFSFTKDELHVITGVFADRAKYSDQLDMPDDDDEKAAYKATARSIAEKAAAQPSAGPVGASSPIDEPELQALIERASTLCGQLFDAQVTPAEADTDGKLLEESADVIRLLVMCVENPPVPAPVAAFSLLTKAVETLQHARSLMAETSLDLCRWVGPIAAPPNVETPDVDSALERLWRLRHYVERLDRCIENYIDPALAALRGPAHIRKRRRKRRDVYALRNAGDK